VDSSDTDLGRGRGYCDFCDECRVRKLCERVYGIAAAAAGYGNSVDCSVCDGNIIALNRPDHKNFNRSGWLLNDATRAGRTGVGDEAFGVGKYLLGGLLNDYNYGGGKLRN